MPDDVIANKAEIIERCLKRIAEIYANDHRNLKEDQLKQDALLLNLERACQATIDLGMRWVRMNSLGIPKENREVFEILKREKLIPEPLAESLKKLVAFRNIAVHDYQEINLDIVQTLIERDFQDLRDFIAIALRNSPVK